MFAADQYWITVAEVQCFSQDAEEVFTRQEWEDLTHCIAIDPLVGDLLPDTDGVRVLRWPAESQGKNGHVRVAYYFRDLNTPVYLLALFRKGERLSLTEADKRIIRALVGDIVAAYGVRRVVYWATADGAA